MSSPIYSQGTNLVTQCRQLPNKSQAQSKEKEEKEFHGQKLSQKQLERLMVIYNKTYEITPNPVNFLVTTLPFRIEAFKTAMSEAGIKPDLYLTANSAEHVIGNLEQTCVELCCCIDSKSSHLIDKVLSSIMRRGISNSNVTFTTEFSAFKELVEEAYLFQSRKREIRSQRKIVGHHIDLGGIRLKFIYLNESTKTNWRQLYFPQEKWFISVDSQVAFYIHDIKIASETEFNHALSMLQNRHLTIQDVKNVNNPLSFYLKKISEGYSQSKDGAVFDFVLKYFLEQVTDPITETFREFAYFGGNVIPRIIHKGQPQKKSNKDLTQIALKQLKASYLKKHESLTKSFTALYQPLVENSHSDRAKAPGLNDRKSPHISNIGRLTIVQPPELSRGRNVDFQLVADIDLKSIGAELFTHTANEQTTIFSNLLPKLKSQLHEKDQKELVTLKKRFETYQFALATFNRHAKTAEADSKESVVLLDSIYSFNEVGTMVIWLNFLDFIVSIPNISEKDCNHYCVKLAAAWKKQMPKSHLLEQMTSIILSMDSAKDLLCVVRGLFLFAGYESYTFPFAENEKTPRLHIRIPCKNGTQYLILKSNPLKTIEDFFDSWDRLDKQFDQFKKQLHPASELREFFSELPKNLNLNIPKLSHQNKSLYISHFTDAFKKTPLSSILAIQYQNQLNLIPFHQSLIDKNQKENSIHHIRSIAESILEANLKDAIKSNQRNLSDLITLILHQLKNPNEISVDTLQKLASLIEIFNKQSANELNKDTLLVALGKGFEAVFQSAIENPKLGIEQLCALQKLFFIGIKSHFIPAEAQPSHALIILLAHTNNISTINSTKILIEIDHFLDTVETLKNQPEKLNNLCSTLRTKVLQSIKSLAEAASKENSWNDSEIAIDFLNRKIQSMSFQKDYERVLPYMIALVTLTRLKPSVDTFLDTGKMTLGFVTHIPKDTTPDAQLLMFARELASTSTTLKKNDIQNLRSLGIRLVVLLANSIKDSAYLAELDNLFLQNMGSALSQTKGSSAKITFSLFCKAFLDMKHVQTYQKESIQVLKNLLNEDYSSKKMSGIRKRFIATVSTFNMPAAIRLKSLKKLTEQMQENDLKEICENTWKRLHQLPLPTNKNELDFMYSLWHLAQFRSEALKDDAEWLKRTMLSIKLLHALCTLITMDEAGPKTQTLVNAIKKFLETGKHHIAFLQLKGLPPLIDAIRALPTFIKPLIRQLSYQLCETCMYTKILSKESAAELDRRLMPADNELQQQSTPASLLQDNLNALSLSSLNSEQENREIVKVIWKVIEPNLKIVNPNTYSAILSIIPKLLKFSDSSPPWDEAKNNLPILLLAAWPQAWNKNKQYDSLLTNFLHMLIETKYFDCASANHRLRFFNTLMPFSRNAAFKDVWNHLYDLSLKNLEEEKILCGLICNSNDTSLIYLLHESFVRSQRKNLTPCVFMLKACSDNSSRSQPDPSIFPLILEDVLQPHVLNNLASSPYMNAAFQHIFQYVTNLSSSEQSSKAIYNYAKVLEEVWEKKAKYLLLPTEVDSKIRESLILSYIKAGADFNESLIILLSYSPDNLNPSTLNALISYVYSLSLSIKSPISTIELVKKILRIFLKQKKHLLISDKNNRQSETTTELHQSMVVDILIKLNPILANPYKISELEDLYQLAVGYLNKEKFTLLNDRVNDKVINFSRLIGELSFDDVRGIKEKLFEASIHLTLASIYDPSLGHDILKELLETLEGCKSVESMLSQMTSLIDQANDLSIYENLPPQEYISVLTSFISVLCKTKNIDFSREAFKRLLLLHNLIVMKSGHIHSENVHYLLASALVVFDRAMISLMCNYQNEFSSSLYKDFLSYCLQLIQGGIPQSNQREFLNFIQALLTRVIHYPSILMEIRKQMDIVVSIKLKTINQESPLEFLLKSPLEGLKKMFPPNKINEPCVDTLKKSLTFLTKTELYLATDTYAPSLGQAGIADLLSPILLFLREEKVANGKHKRKVEEIISAVSLLIKKINDAKDLALKTIKDFKNKDSETKK